MEEQLWARSVAEKIRKKYPEVVKRNKGKIPYTAVNGCFDDQTDRNINWWTNGFYGGMLWQLYHGDGQQMYREALFAHGMMTEAGKMPGGQS